MPTHDRKLSQQTERTLPRLARVRHVSALRGGLRSEFGAWPAGTGPGALARTADDPAFEGR